MCPSVNGLAERIALKWHGPHGIQRRIYYHDDKETYGTIDSRIWVQYWIAGWEGYRPASAATLAEAGFHLINANHRYYCGAGRRTGESHTEQVRGFDGRVFDRDTVIPPACRSHAVLLVRPGRRRRSGRWPGSDRAASTCDCRLWAGHEGLEVRDFLFIITQIHFEKRGRHKTTTTKINYYSPDSHLVHPAGRREIQARGRGETAPSPRKNETDALKALEEGGVAGNALVVYLGIWGGRLGRPFGSRKQKYQKRSWTRGGPGTSSPHAPSPPPPAGGGGGPREGGQPPGTGKRNTP